MILPDGRRLSYEIYGIANGFPIFYCHGFPASRLEGKLFEADAVTHGIRLIVADRPGYGGSDFQPGRQIIDWQQDVRRLADYLHLQRYSVMGMSGGAPYAVCCGVAPDPRLYRLGIISGLGQLHRPGASRGMGAASRLFIMLARHSPRLAIPFYTNIMGPVLQRFPDGMIWILTSAAPECDQEIFRDKALRSIHLQTAREAFRQGGRAAGWDLHLYTRPWQFDPGDVGVASYVWHGEEDGTVPVRMGREYAAQLPACRARFLPGEGHFSLPVKYMGEVLEVLSGKADG